eukprot:CAMPEP_0179369362 /NCGR_PEP_ID=MMETSP0797-20121207/84579_1 /TAXON_ID=47934 /ORGANISM="Dinophysis acuminata, Strain DAEP01" /LENGTH=247 /DNA_ID=CAMNT_0021084997 /DNA_START=77 /DNA_END=816 /DNA_ORIENTATION=-
MDDTRRARNPGTVHLGLGSFVQPLASAGVESMVQTHGIDDGEPRVLGMTQEQIPRLLTLGSRFLEDGAGVGDPFANIRDDHCLPSGRSLSASSEDTAVATSTTSLAYLQDQSDVASPYPALTRLADLVVDLKVERGGDDALVRGFVGLVEMFEKQQAELKAVVAELERKHDAAKQAAEIAKAEQFNAAVANEDIKAEAAKLRAEIRSESEAKKEAVREAERERRERQVIIKQMDQVLRQSTRPAPAA